jgi:hypothetical protein
MRGLCARLGGACARARERACIFVALYFGVQSWSRRRRCARRRDVSSGDHDHPCAGGNCRSGPSLVAAPIDGVIRDILVLPGSHVDAGTPLIAMVDTKLRNDVEVATRAKAVAESKYFKILQSSVDTQKDVEDLAVAKAEYLMAQAELASAQDQLSRTIVRAQKTGVGVYSSPSDWQGRPVGAGERIMEIDDPESLEARIDLPISDAVNVKPGDAARVFLDGAPLKSIPATIERVPYRASATPERQMAFRIFARLNAFENLQIGLRGTARLDGERVALGFYLFRRPISSLRQKLGF